MQKVLNIEEAEEYTEYMDDRVVRYIRDGRTETFESYQKYTLFVFPFYDIRQPGMASKQIMVYMDHEDLLLLCEGQRGFERVRSLFEKGVTNECALWGFFQNLLKNDMDNLEDLECEVAEAEMAAMVRFQNDYIRKIIAYRKELLRLKRYYEQLDTIMDSLILNENKLLSQDGIQHFTILANRTTRYLQNVLNLRDYVTQMREAYQSQIDIEQNNLMRLFTVITTVFQPLTLMVGWYGMNFSGMPEMDWTYAYPVFIGASALVCVSLLAFFKKKRWV
ncbi:MAG: magnesium transporter [Eubacterium sp.]|nr:magnesium transporter [Eubacterium sp.]